MAGVVHLEKLHSSATLGLTLSPPLPAQPICWWEAPLHYFHEGLEISYSFQNLGINYDCLLHWFNTSPPLITENNKWWHDTQHRTKLAFERLTCLFLDKTILMKTTVLLCVKHTLKYLLRKRRFKKKGSISSMNLLLCSIQMQNSVVAYYIATFNIA